MSAATTYALIQTPFSNRLDMNTILRRVLAMALPLAFCPMAVHAVTFNVNVTQDSPDAHPGDGICSTNPVLDPEKYAVCSLRAAVMEGNVIALVQPVTIMLKAGTTYKITTTGAADDTGAKGDFDLLRPMTIRVPENFASHAVIDANLIDRAFDIHAASVLYGLEIVHGYRTDGDATAIRSHVSGTSLQRLDIHGNTVGPQSGAVASIVGGAVVLMDSSVHSNGTIDATANAVSAYSKPATLLRSSVYANFGPGIRVQDGGNLSLQSSTISGNTGTGIFLLNASGTIRNSTISSNGSTGVVYSSLVAGPHQLNMIGSIVNAGNGSFACHVDDHSFDDATFTASWNAYSDLSCISDNADDNSLHGIDLDLGELQDNGGPTPTHLPDPTSAVVDHAPASACNNYPLDQRGFVRPISYNGVPMPRCDIGAVELQAGELPTGLFTDGFE